LGEDTGWVEVEVDPVGEKREVLALNTLLIKAVCDDKWVYYVRGIR